MRHMTLRPTATAVGLVALLASGGALAAVEWEFSDWDGDGNLELTEREFTTRATELGLYDEWDVDNDDLLDEDELYGGLYDTWDLDGDGLIGEDEFGESVERWFTETDYDFAAWDADDDGFLDEDEFRAAIAETGLYDTWIGDAEGIGEEQFYSGYYEVADLDDDDVLTEDEFGWFEDTLGTDVAAETIGDPLEGAEVVSLAGWGYDELYAEGWRAEWLLDSDVYGPEGEEIGEVEDIIVGPDGNILSVVAEVGGFWDIGDTHVSVPWDEVEVGDGGDYVQIPVTEETVEDYGIYADTLLTAEEAAEEMAKVDDAETGYRAWRVDELIGDYTYLQDRRDYGYVDDLIFNTAGELQAVVVQPDVGYGVGGYYAYPYYGYDYGWDPGYDYYELPYTAEEAGELEPFEYGELDEDTFTEVE